MTDETGASVVFCRPPKFWRDRLRKYKLILDGQLVAELSRGAEATLHVAPGQHRAQARISWTGSAEVVFDVRPGQVVRLIVEPGTGRILEQSLSTDQYLSLSVEGTPSNR